MIFGINTQFIQITDRTCNPHKLIGLERNETAGSLGGYPKHIEDVPESLWNPQGSLDFRVDYVSDPMYAGGAMAIRNALKWRRNYV